MKNPILIIPFFFFTFNLLAQNNEKVLGSVKYQLFHQRDTLSPEYYQEYMGLVFNSHSTVYFSLNKATRDSVMKAQFEEQMKRSPDNLKIDIRSAPGFTPGAYYSFYQDDKAIMERPFMQVTYVYDEPLPKINWVLADDTKNIGTYNCKKAIGSFAGRQYIAWYCPEIAVNAGPWRLAGLPGLILEANDTTQQVKFIFQSFSTEDFYNRETIALPAKAEKTTKVEFEKMLKAMRDNPEEVLKNAMQGGGTIKINSITPPARNLYNNQMELPEKR